MPEEVKTESAPVTPPAQPAVDISKITQDAAAIAAQAASEAAKAEAVRISNERLKEAARVLTGEPAKGEEKINPLLEYMLNDPQRYARELKELTKKELREEMSRQTEHERTTKKVCDQIFREYPEINTPARLAMVDSICQGYERAGLAYGEALKKGFEEAVKDLGLKSVTELQAEGKYVHGIPGGGGGYFGASQPPRNESKLSQDFVTQMRQRLVSQKTRTRTAAA